MLFMKFWIAVVMELKNEVFVIVILVVGGVVLAVCGITAKGFC